jgi:predicted enzyme related to lactoylglutathione lyase
MFRLMEILLYTPDVARMQSFYEEVLGLSASSASPSWTAFSTRGALLALRPVPKGNSPYVELTFETDDLDAAMTTLRGRGAEMTGEITMHGWGRLVRFRDSEGNALALAQPRTSMKGRDARGLSLGTAVVGARDLAAAKAFYHHVMALRMVLDTPRWVQFDTGPTGLAVLPRGRDGAIRPISIGFSIPNLMDWAEDARQRGLHFATAPRDEDWGLFSNALDPDGNEVRFFEPSAPPALEEELAQSFENDQVPHQVAIRKSVKKASKAASRVALRPEYKGREPLPRRRPSATTTRVASVRGAGQAQARLKPKRTADEKKAKVKPATRRQLKAKLAVLETKKTDVARASKGRLVKRGASRPSRRVERRTPSGAGRKR